MNIFYLDKDPLKSALAMTDKHIVKMSLEAAQLLCTAHRVLDGQTFTQVSASGANLTRYNHPTLDSVLYKATHINHPSAIWVRESADNYLWLYNHFLSLCAEYTRRYDKTHRSYTDLNAYLSQPPTNIPHDGPTPVRIAITDTKWHRECPVQSYRAYYVGEKLKLQHDLNRYMEVLYE
jgi:hypothetical protein